MQNVKLNLENSMQDGHRSAQNHKYLLTNVNDQAGESIVVTYDTFTSMKKCAKFACRQHRTRGSNGSLNTDLWLEITNTVGLRSKYDECGYSLMSTSVFREWMKSRVCTKILQSFDTLLFNLFAYVINKWIPGTGLSMKPILGWNMISNTIDWNYLKFHTFFSKR